MRKEFDCIPVYNKIFLETKIKYYSDEATDIYHKEIPKVGSDFTCLAVITIDSTLKKEENYNPQVFLKDCKLIKKGLIRQVTEDTEAFSSEIKSRLKVNVVMCF